MRYALALLAILLATSPSWATDYTAASCNNTAASPHIQDAITLATVAGDRVIIPAGSCTWTKLLAFPQTHAITLMGSGTMPAIGSATSGGTTITWNQTGDMSNAVINFYEVPGAGNATIANIRFELNDAAVRPQFGLIFIALGSVGSKPVIVHHVTMYQTVTSPFHLIYGSSMRGIIYRNDLFNAVAYGSPADGNSGPTISCKGGEGSLTHRGNWMAASTMGTADTAGTSNMYIETNRFTRTGGAADLDDGCRGVFRYNTLIDSSLGDHGNDTSFVGVRHYEIYNNDFQCVDDWNHQTWYGTRGGTGVIADNIIPGTCYARSVARVKTQVQAVRRNVYTAASPTGTTASGSPIITSMSSTTGILAGQTFVGTNIVGSPATTVVSVDSSTQITMSQNATGNGSGITLTFYDCYPGPYPWARQPGWGWSGLGTEADGALDPPAFDTFQTLEPLYIWNNKNTSGGTPGEADAATPTDDGSLCAFDNSSQTTAGYVQQNREYYLSTAKPSYTKYQYPHDLATVVSGEAVSPEGARGGFGLPFRR